MTSTKVLTETKLCFVPSNHPYFNNQNGFQSVYADQEDLIPTIDFSLLTKGSSDQRSRVICDLSKACEEWGFFMVINHGVAKDLVERVFNAADDFFDLRVEEKEEFNGKLPLDPIRCGSSYDNADKSKIFFWREYLKVLSYPDFNFPNKPLGFSFVNIHLTGYNDLGFEAAPKKYYELYFDLYSIKWICNIRSEVALEYCMKSREVAMELIKGVVQSLGIKEGEMKEALNLDKGLQMFVINQYKPCSCPEAIGLPPHTDQGLLTLLMQNGVEGLQVQHNGKWIIVNEIPNAFIVIVGDQLEIFSNGKYKSAMHRAIVNDKANRLSIAMPHGPSLDTILGPYCNLIKSTNQQPKYTPMQYKEYIEQQIVQAMRGKTLLEQSKIRCD